MVQTAADNMYALIKEFYPLNRTAVSKDSDKLAEHLRQTLDCRSLEFRSGDECFTWLVPKRWNVREGYLAHVDGTRVVDFHENPLHLWTNSVSVDTDISRGDLEAHLHFDSSQPEWVPYHYRNGYRYDVEEWGFSLSYNDYKRLNDDRYRVHIDADLDNNGTMKVIDCWLQGEYTETVLIAAHTCHPAQVTDGMSNVAVATELFKRLKVKPSLRYSYRLVLGPEYFAAAGFLSTIPESEISSLNAGIFLDMLGNNERLGYQSSFQGDSLLDRIVKNIFNHHVENHITRPYRGLWGNDETFYNGPGFLIPTMGIGGGHHPEYHFDKDNLDMVNMHQLEGSLILLEKIIELLETDFVPVRMFRGPIYQSRYGIYVDPKIDPNGYRNIEAIQIMMDGNRSCFDISHELDIDFFFVREFCDQLHQKGLLEKKFVNCFV